jgi:hypothetical protein
MSNSFCYLYLRFSNQTGLASFYQSYNHTIAAVFVFYLSNRFYVETL